MKKYIPYLIILAIGIVIGGGMCSNNHVREVTKKVTDTLVIRDTHVIEKPVMVEKHSKDTVYVKVTDTLHIRDSVYIVLPMESKTYKGEDYKAQVSGYQPSLDWIEVYPKREVISKTETTTKIKSNTLSFGIEASYCNTLSIPIYIEYERMLHKNFAITAGGFYDLPLRLYGFKVGGNIQFSW